MKYCRCLFLIVLFSSISLFSQEKIRQHTVSKGETISEIAKKYNLKSEAIYELNPDAVNGIKPKMVLLIPAKSKKKQTNLIIDAPSNSSEKTHEVQPKETLYGIAKQYHLTIEELNKINPNLENEGLKTGQKIKIPQTNFDDFATLKTSEKPIESQKNSLSSKKTPKEENVLSKENQIEGIPYEILPKESLYSIAKKYGITLADLQKANPQLGKKSLKVGQIINLPVKAELSSNTLAEAKEIKTEKEPVVDASPTEQPRTAPVQQQPIVENSLKTEKITPVLPETAIENKATTADFTHEVLPKESLYLIAKKYGITLADLQKANPQLGKKSLRVGQKINLPAKALANAASVAAKNEAKSQKDVVVVPQVATEEQKAETEVAHEVLPKETKYGIAKQYGLTVAELEKQNPAISKKLLVGSMLKIRSSKLAEKEVAVEKAIVLETDFVKGKFENKSINMTHDASFVDQLISKASENIGTRYRSGGTTTAGFDCSGLMCYTFSSYDIKLPRSSGEMAAYGSKVDAQDAQKGDLIFFKTRGSGRINHVGMVVEVLDGEIKFIHSATHGGVIISSTKESYYERNLAQINRVL